MVKYLNHSNLPYVIFIIYYIYYYILHILLLLYMLHHIIATANRDVRPLPHPTHSGHLVVLLSNQLGNSVKQILSPHIVLLPQRECNPGPVHNYPSVLKIVVNCPFPFLWTVVRQY